ncbi:carboxypeptidase family protein [Lacibacter cauensis]|uniref:Carboxypeptidase family protein n=1 Tax=Lacibacter cauensis TaxID=510947 RepID=A0A562SDY5_9BACT|nr:carboxypeptidase regulatory-like domain-containing protein [Lacibacter cauensis]TWI79144.1 carboxypeptidase family protein [Lacibacter cauensis]
MKIRFVTLTLFTFFFMIFSSAEIVNFLPAVVKGQVIDSETGKPVRGAHVFIIRGEEEVFSSAKGDFYFKTWNLFPLTVTVEHKLYKPVKVRVASETDLLKVTLTPLN